MKSVLSFIVICLFSFGFTLNGQNVEISIDHPNQVNAGEEFAFFSGSAAWFDRR